MVLPLSGIQVVELSRDVSGPICGLALADMGAEVMKVENPRVDLHRDGGPLWKAAMFVAYNRNKKSITLDLESDDGRIILAKLLKTADVFLENLPPGVVDKMGFSYERVVKTNPKIVYCSIKSYLPGPYGDRDVEDTMVETQAGYPAHMGEEGTEGTLTYSSPPLKLGVPIAALEAGQLANVWIVGTLFTRMKTGIGDYIQVGEFETCLNTIGVGEMAVWKEWGKQTAINYKTKDGGWVHGRYIFRTDDRWKAFCDSFGVSKEDFEATDTEEKREALGGQTGSGMKKIIAKYFSQFTLEEARKKIIDDGIIAGAAVTMKEVLENDQIKPKLIPLLVDSTVGMTPQPTTVMQMMLPIRSKDYNPQATSHWTAAPKLGQDTKKVLSALGYTEAEITDLEKRGVI
ncbi:MAG: CaiB/BaiF CoA-transferase family protein [Candidatus Bathyarchaeota archaeon]